MIESVDHSHDKVTAFQTLQALGEVALWGIREAVIGFLERADEALDVFGADDE